MYLMLAFFISILPEIANSFVKTSIKASFSALYIVVLYPFC